MDSFAILGRRQITCTDHTHTCDNKYDFFKDYKSIVTHACILHQMTNSYSKLVRYMYMYVGERGQNVCNNPQLIK